MAKLEVKITSGGITFRIDRKLSISGICDELVKIANMIQSSFDDLNYSTILDDQSTSSESYMILKENDMEILSTESAIVNTNSLWRTWRVMTM